MDLCPAKVDGEGIQVLKNMVDMVVVICTRAFQRAGTAILQHFRLLTFAVFEIPVGFDP